MKSFKQLKTIITILYLGIIVLLFPETSIYSSGFLNKISGSTIKILPFGNSITYDTRSNDLRNIGDKAGYRAPLYNLLKSAGYKFDFIGSEHSGGNYLPAGYDENGGFPGITDDELLYLLRTGQLLQPSQGIDRQVTAGPYLSTFSPDVILLHIGTNNNDQPDGTSASEVEQILDEIDNFEASSGKEVIVLLARIINRVPNQSYVNQFNNNIESMSLDRVSNPLNDAYPDNIVIVDMQDSANFNYVISPDPNNTPGDMNDALHPNSNGYIKMAEQWFGALEKILPNPPKIINGPKDQYSVEGKNATFKISAISEDPLLFQWRKNGSNIPLANDSTFTITNLEVSDNNSEFSCMVSNNNGVVISNSAKLYVNSSSERISKSILAEYKFDEGSGNSINNSIDNTSSLDLNILSPSSILWIENGISIENNPNISTDQAAIGIIDSINTHNEFTFELWISSNLLEQFGPARILTISASGNERNFTIGQSADSLIFKTRTTETDLDGNPIIYASRVIRQNSLKHIVITKDKFGLEKIYIDGELTNTIVLEGDLSNWNSNYKLSIGNEFGTNFPWIGNFYHLAVYKRALFDEEVHLNYSLGKDAITSLRKNEIIPSDYKLFQNYPNPFNPSTTISFNIPQISMVNLGVYNTLGEKISDIVIDEILSEGLYGFKFNPIDLTSGVYFYKLTAKNIYSTKVFTQTKKLILLK